jgi:hypothetical protein
VNRRGRAVDVRVSCVALRSTSDVSGAILMIEEVLAEAWRPGPPPGARPAGSTLPARICPDDPLRPLRLGLPALPSAAAAPEPDTGLVARPSGAR